MISRLFKYIVPILFAIMIAAMIIGWTQTFGWVYSLAFAFSAIPQALKSIKDKNSDGVAGGTLFLWIIGEIAGTIYGLSLMQWPIILNCALNTVWVSIIVYYRLFPKRS